MQASQEEVVSLVAPGDSRFAMWDRLPQHRDHFCDISLRSVDGQVFRAHRLVLSMASDPLSAMLCGSFAEGHQSEVALESSSEALSGFLEFVYAGKTDIKKSFLPELLRLVHQWEVQPLQASLTKVLVDHMTPDLCSPLIVDCEVILAEELNEVLERYILENFAACAATERFGSWPLHRLVRLLRSDELVVESEEEVLAAVLRWHSTGPGRDDATAALLQMVRFPLLAVASLEAIRCREGLAGVPGVELARLAAAGLRSHAGPRREDARDAGHAIASTLNSRRNAFPYWWADFGCSIRGGTLVACRRQREASSGGESGGGAEVDCWAEQDMEPWAVHVHAGALYIITGRHPSRVLRWPGGCGGATRVVAGPGSVLGGVSDFSDISDIAVDASGDLYVLDGKGARIVRIHDGVGEVVGDGRLVLDDTRAIYIDASGAIFFVDEGGSRVQRYADGVTTIVAGGNEAGDGAAQLQDAEDVCVGHDGAVYVSDSGNNRIQKWVPGASQGITVAGGNGEGRHLNQLHYPVGVGVTDDGTVYVADYQNHRIMKWKEGWRAGLVVAGGHGFGAGLHQLREPIDLTIDSSDGAMYISDNGNKRVVRWAAPQHLLEEPPPPAKRRRVDDPARPGRRGGAALDS